MSSRIRLKWKGRIIETSYIFTEPEASELAKLRIAARKKRRITYDCLNAIVQYYPQDCVKCKRGKKLGRGNMGLISVLAGRSGKACQDCKDYTTDKVQAKIIGHRVYD